MTHPILAAQQDEKMLKGNQHLDSTCTNNSIHNPAAPPKKMSRKKRKWLKQQQQRELEQQDHGNSNHSSSGCWYTIWMDIDKSKFFHHDYAVLEGDIQANVFVEERLVLKRGERVFVVCRRQVPRLYQTLVGKSLLEQQEIQTKEDCEGNNNNNSTPFCTTGWLRHEMYGLHAAIRLPLGGCDPSCGNIKNNASYLTLNKRGIKCLDLPGEFVGLFDQIDRINKDDDGTTVQLVLPTNDDDDDDKNDHDILTIRQSDLQERLTRHCHFAKWLIDKFGLERLNSGSGVLDVAGGNGKLSNALVALGVTSCTILDPQPLCTTTTSSSFSNGNIWVVARPLDGDGSALTNSSSDEDDMVAKRIQNCSIVVGLHPDQATEAVVDLALRLGKPFAVSPCCVMTKLFPHRRNVQGDPVRTVWALCRYLLEKSPSPSCPFQVDFLPFAGRNKVIFWNGHQLQNFCQETTE